MNIFTINRNYKTLQTMYIKLLHKEENKERLVSILQDIINTIALDRNLKKRINTRLKLQLTQLEDAYEQTLLHNVGLVNEINKLEEVIRQEILLKQYEITVGTIKKVKGGKVANI